MLTLRSYVKTAMSLKAILAGAEHKLTICLSPPSALKLHITDYYA